MRLPVSTWPDIEAWLQKSKTIVIPIGSFEQHGPNGFIGTDALCPEIIANHAESLAPDDILVGPTFNVGPGGNGKAHETSPFAGQGCA